MQAEIEKIPAYHNVRRKANVCRVLIPFFEYIADTTHGMDQFFAG